MKHTTLLLASLFASISVFAQQGKRVLLATSKADHTLAVINPADLSIITKLPTGPNPHEVVVAPDGKIAYVSNPGNSDLHEINVLDIAHLKALPNIDTTPFLGPHGMAYLNNKIWFTAQGSKSVARYDVATAKMDFAMGTGQDVTHLLYVTPNGNTFYTTNVESGTVSIFEHLLLQPTVPPTGVLPPTAKPHWDWVQTIIPAGKGCEGFDVSPDGKELWTATPEGIISIINTDAKKISTTITTNVKGLHRLKFTPDGKRVAIISVRTGDLLFFDTKTRKEIKRIKTGQGAAMLMDAVGNRLFLSCSPNDYIAVIDLAKMEVSGRLETGGRPDGLEWAITE
nr:YncE family protein [uncultured Flavobacterium sp.]